MESICPLARTNRHRDPFSFDTLTLNNAIIIIKICPSYVVGGRLKIVRMTWAIELGWQLAKTKLALKTEDFTPMQVHLSRLRVENASLFSHGGFMLCEL